MLYCTPETQNGHASGPGHHCPTQRSTHNMHIVKSCRGRSLHRCLLRICSAQTWVPQHRIHLPLPATVPHLPHGSYKQREERCVPARTLDAVGSDGVPLAALGALLRRREGRELEGVVLVADAVVIVHVQRLAQARVRKRAVVACVL